MSRTLDPFTQKVLNLVKKKPGITIADLERAISLAKRRIAAKDSVALPPVPEVLR